MRTSDLDYQLPASLIAAYPAPKRDESRLLVVREHAVEHAAFHNLVQLLPANAVLVVNDTRVIPARLHGHKHTGGMVEVLLVSRASSDVGEEGRQRWSAMVRSSRPVRAGTTLSLATELDATVEQAADARGLIVLVLSARGDTSVDDVVRRRGHVPLPPYLRREDEPSDHERYQTVYARAPGAVAAPTAGLHFSHELLAKLKEHGVTIATLTLHVGPGTFRPVTSHTLDEHPMHAERYDLPQQTADAIAAARQRGAQVVAVGTTVVRALESAADEARPGCVHATRAETRLLIQPGYRFRVVDALITNFHLPRSTLLALVYAFGGADRVSAAYSEAVAQGYRFYSYGDAMYLPARTS